MTQRHLFPLLLVGLPVGLIVTGVAAMFLYFWKPSPAPAVILGVARQEVSLKALGDSMTLLTRELGTRQLTDVTSLRNTANYLESTLGPRNIGYTVTRTTWPHGQQHVPTLSADLLGSSHPDEWVIVTARYDTESPVGGADDATNVAALMSLAHSCVGQHPQRSIRWLLYAGDGLRHEGETLRARGEKVVLTVHFRGLGRYAESGSQLPYLGIHDWPAEPRFLALIGADATGRWLSTAATAWGTASTLPLVTRASALAGERLLEPFLSANVPTLLATDTQAARGLSPETDRGDLIDGAQLLQAVRGLESFIRVVAGAPNNSR
jgi:hypothetical protein